MQIENRWRHDPDFRPVSTSFHLEPRSTGHADGAVGPLARRLGQFTVLSQADQQALAELEEESAVVAAGSVLIAEGKTPEMVLPLLEGLAYRHKDFRDGRRQILTLLLPGDICGSRVRADAPSSYGVRSLTRVKVARISPARFQQVLEAHPAIDYALSQAALIESAILRAWLTNLGQRDARERLAHLLLEVSFRMEQYGLLLRPDVFALPFSQQELGSILGLTNVHINRILRKMRDDNLLEFSKGVVHIHEMDKLYAMAEFDPAYLSRF